MQSPRCQRELYEMQRGRDGGTEGRMEERTTWSENGTKNSTKSKTPEDLQRDRDMIRWSTQSLIRSRSRNEVHGNPRIFNLRFKDLRVFVVTARRRCPHHHTRPRRSLHRPRRSPHLPRPLASSPLCSSPSLLPRWIWLTAGSPRFETIALSDRGGNCRPRRLQRRQDRVGYNNAGSS